MIDEIYSYFLPDYGQLITEVINYYVTIFVGGVLVSFIAWSIGYAVHSIYRWLNDTTKDR